MPRTIGHAKLKICLCNVTTKWKCYLALCVTITQSKYPSCYVWGLVQEIWHFWIVTWLLDRNATWPYEWAPSHWVITLPSFGGHGPHECQDITFLIGRMTTWWIVMWLWGWGFLILTHYPAKFGVHRPYGSGYTGVCNISSNSNSNPNSNA